MMALTMFRPFEKLLNPTEQPAQPEPPAGLLAFYWHFAGQAKWLFVALFVIEFFQALLDAVIPWFFGRIVTLAGTVPREQYLTEGWPVLRRHRAGPAGRAARGRLYALPHHQPGDPGPFTNLIRWQAHWHVVRQSWAFFQNDFAGRIANRVMQTGRRDARRRWSPASPRSGTCWFTAPPR